MKHHCYGIDQLRIIACLLVILIHSCECYYITHFMGVGSYETLDVLALEAGKQSNYATSSIDIDNLKYEVIFAIILETITRCSVPIFVMISGYLLLPLKEKMSMGDFYRQRAKRLVIPLAFWTVIYSFYTTFKLESGLITVWDYVGNILKEIGCSFINFPSHIGHLWYVYMLIGLYIIIPVLSPWVERATRRQMHLILSIWIFTLLLPCIRLLWKNVWGECPWNIYGTQYYISGFIGYLLLGAYARKYLYNTERKYKKLGMILLLTGFMLSVSNLLYQANQLADGINMDSMSSVANAFNVSLSFCSIPMFLEAIGLFLICFKWSLKRMPSIMNDFSQYSYGIYLCHLLFLVWSCENIFIQFRCSSPVIIVMICIFTTITSFLVIKIAKKVPLLKQVAG